MSTSTSAPSGSTIQATWTCTPAADLLIALAGVAYPAASAVRHRRDDAHWPSGAHTQRGTCRGRAGARPEQRLAVYADQVSGA